MQGIQFLVKVSGNFKFLLVFIAQGNEKVLPIIFEIFTCLEYTFLFLFLMPLIDCGVCLPPCDFPCNCNPDVFHGFGLVGVF